MKAKLALLTLVVIAGCTRDPDPAKFAAAYEAGKVLQGSTEVGVTFGVFREQVQHLAAGVSIAKDKAETSMEKSILGRYSEALAVYQDAVTLWQARGPKPGNIVIGYANARSGPLVEIVDKYGLKTEIAYGTTGTLVVPSASVSTVITQADERLTKANAALK